MPTDVTQLPSIGCFRLSPGRSATGDFAGHVLTVRVDGHGESCLADSAAFNCSGCIDGGKDGCAARLAVNSRDPDGTVNFTIARKASQYAYALTQEDFDAVQKQVQARAQEPARTPGLGAIPLPDGPYSSWPEDKKKAVASLTMRCVILAVMQFGNYKGPREAAQEMVQAEALACIEHQMPDDWPDRSVIQKMESAHLEKATVLDPALSLPPDEVWREIARKLKENAAPPTGTK